MTSSLIIAEKCFRSRLLMGSGKFASYILMRDSIAAAESQIVTVALRRVDLAKSQDDILHFIDRSRIQLLPNTSGARDAREAVRLAMLAREAGLGDWVKLEVVPEPRYLLPDPVETFLAAQELVREGFTVLPYMPADPILALRLTDVGCAAVMPLGSPIGSNRGLRTRDALRIIVEQARVPVIVDAGLGAPSHAAEAMELGVDAVLVNTAIAISHDPVNMARAFASGVIAGRMAYEAGLPAAQITASASSSPEGIPHAALHS